MDPRPAHEHEQPTCGPASAWSDANTWKSLKPARGNCKNLSVWASWMTTKLVWRSKPFTTLMRAL
eukprot:2039269-Amphidinium_carterae.4